MLVTAALVHQGLEVDHGGAVLAVRPGGAVLEPLQPHLGCKLRVNDRRVISGIPPPHRYREGLRWRAVPAEHVPRTTLFNRFDC